jgi:hypothetical protein
MIPLLEIKKSVIGCGSLAIQIGITASEVFRE